MFVTFFLFFFGSDHFSQFNLSLLNHLTTVEELISLLKNIEPLPTPGTPSSKVPELQNKDAIFRVIAISTTIADKALVNTVAWAKQIPGNLRITNF